MHILTVAHELFLREVPVGITSYCGVSREGVLLPGCSSLVKVVAREALYRVRCVLDRLILRHVLAIARYQCRIRQVQLTDHALG
jgi:hypothetical protein